MNFLKFTKNSYSHLDQQTSFSENISDATPFLSLFSLPLSKPTVSPPESWTGTCHAHGPTTGGRRTELLLFCLIYREKKNAFNFQTVGFKNSFLVLRGSICIFPDSLLDSGLINLPRPCLPMSFINCSSEALEKDGSCKGDVAYIKLGSVMFYWDSQMEKPLFPGNSPTWSLQFFQ